MPGIYLEGINKQWAEMVLQGVKQRFHECGKYN